MPENTILSTEQARQNYLGQDRSVNLQKNLDEQKKVQESGLQDIEIRKTAKNLGKDDFLQLLITQLTYQDPTSPVKDQQFIAQMAQFSSLEQMQNMATAVNRMADRQGQNLIGKFIVGKDYVTGDQVSGVAGAFFFDDQGDAFLKVGGRAMSVKDVVLVGDPSQFKKEVGGTGEAPAANNAAKTQTGSGWAPAAEAAEQQPGAEPEQKQTEQKKAAAGTAYERNLAPAMNDGGAEKAAPGGTERQ